MMHLVLSSSDTLLIRDSTILESWYEIPRLMRTLQPPAVHEEVAGCPPSSLDLPPSPSPHPQPPKFILRRG